MTACVGTRLQSSVRGREAELERVSTLLRRAAETGQGGLGVVFGEPGIGKTAMLDAAVDHARACGFAVGIGRAQELEQIAPMAPLLEALRSGPAPLLSGQGFAELAPLYGHQVWLVDRLTGMLEERVMREPVLIAVDDLHWADKLTLFALRIIPRRLAGSPIVWLVTSRPQSSSAARYIIASVSRDVAVQTLELAPLSPDAVEEIARDRLGRPPDAALRTLLTGAGGSPLLVVDLLDGFAKGDAAQRGGLPRSFVTGVLDRLDGLPSGILRLVQAGSVLGRAFRPDDVAALIDIGADALLPTLEGAVRAGLLDDNGRELAFRHDLIRRSIYEDLPPTVRNALHRRAAELFAGPKASVVDAVPHVLAYATPPDPKSAAVLRRAAALVVSSMPETAADLIVRGYGLLEAADPASLETGKEAIAILRLAQRGRDAVRIADALLGRVTDPAEMVQIEVLAAEPLWEAGQLDDLLARVDRALQAVGVEQDARIVLTAYRSLARSHGPDLEDAAREAAAALEEARQRGDEPSQIVALRALGETARNQGRHDVALRSFQLLRPLAGTEHAIEEIVSLQLLDRYEESGSLLAAERSRILETGAPARSVARVAFAQMWQAYSLARLDEAEAEACTILRQSEEFDEDAFGLEARLVLSRLAQLRGDLPEARRHFALAQARRRGEVQNVLLLLMEAWLHEAEGDLSGAVGAVERVIRPSGGVRHRWQLQPAWLVAAARIAVLAREIGLAKEVASVAVALDARNPGVVTLAGAAAHASALAAESRDGLEGAARTLRTSPRPLMRADAIGDYGTALLRAGAASAGAALIDEAWTLYEMVGATGETRRFERVLGEAGIRRRRQTLRRPTEGWDALTGIERRVARLIAEGHTNRTAAAELALSPNTVGTHVRSIFGKLGVQSRVHMTRVVLKAIDSPE